MSSGDDDAEDLYERAPCGYLSTAVDGTIVRVNETFLAMTGYRSDELVGRKRFSQLLTVGGRIYYETHYAPMLRMQGQARGIAAEILSAGGQRLPVLLNSVVHGGEGDTPIIVRTAVFEATERREYERELLRAKVRAEASEAHATSLARTLQQTLIPPIPPDIPGLDVAAAYRPARDGSEVGGDFYDVFAVSDREWIVTIGDVCGKGAQAAVVTALARYTLRTAAVSMREPSDALKVLNNVLRIQDSDRFVTAAMLRLRLAEGAWTVTIACAGHPLPLVAPAGATASTRGEAGSLLGVVEDIDVSDVDVSLSPGDTLVVYTDGVTEARQAGEFFGEDRLAAGIAKLAGSASAVTNGLLAEVLDFQSGDARDDIAIVTLMVPT